MSADASYIEDDAPFETRLKGRVLWLVLNRPGRGNALSMAVMRALRGEIEAASSNRDVRVVVLAAEGRIFSAGHDIFEMYTGGDEEGTREEQRAVLETCKGLMLSIMHCDKPVIACVDGIATAGGAQLVSACDLAVASHRATFCLPGVNFGGFCTTPLVGIGRNIHRKHAMEMALTGEMMSAEDAWRMGLVNRVVPAAELEDSVQELAAKIASRPVEGVRHGKRAFYEQMDMSIEEAFVYAIDRMAEACSCDPARAGLAAMQRKEAPDWGED